MVDLDFCKSCHGLTLKEITDKIDARIRSLEGRVKVEKKKARFEVGKLDKVYEAEIKELGVMAEYISGDNLAGKNLTEAEKKTYNEIIEKIKRSG